LINDVKYAQQERKISPIDIIDFNRDEISNAAASMVHQNIQSKLQSGGTVMNFKEYKHTRNVENRPKESPHKYHQTGV
jgi:hypothetical protein